jgi:glycosyltransferase involved in cell wall biosynthesis
MDASEQASQVAMMNAPLVSVLVPAYNHEKFVLQCLESVLAEGYPNLELLIVDDGSKDDTYQVARLWCDLQGGQFQRCEVLRQENHGLVFTLNRLVRLAYGEFITLLASDDALLPGGIALRVQELQKRPDWMAIFADAQGMDANGSTTHESVLGEVYFANKHALSEDKLRAFELILRWSVPGPVFLARRTCYEPERIGLYDEELSFEDRDYYLRLLSQNALGFVDSVVARYRMHETNLSQSTIKDPAKVAVGIREMRNSEFQNLKRFRGAKKFALYLRWNQMSAQTNWLQNRSYLRIFSRMKALLFKLFCVIFVKLYRYSPFIIIICYLGSRLGDALSS